MQGFFNIGLLYTILDEIFLKNYHPALAAFPGVICILLLGCEIFSFKFPKILISRLYLISALVIFTPFSYFSGKRAHYLISEQQKTLEILTTHQLLAKAFLILLIPLCLFGIASFFNKQKTMLSLYYLCLIIALGLVFNLSLIGGKLVFEHGLGINNL